MVSLDAESAGPFPGLRCCRRLAAHPGDTPPGVGAPVVLYGNQGGAEDFRLRDFYQAGAYNRRVIGFISTVSRGDQGRGRRYPRGWSPTDASRRRSAGPATGLRPPTRLPPWRTEFPTRRSLRSPTNGPSAAAVSSQADGDGRFTSGAAALRRHTIGRPAVHPGLDHLDLRRSRASVVGPFGTAALATPCSFSGARSMVARPGDLH